MPRLLQAQATIAGWGPARTFVVVLSAFLMIAVLWASVVRIDVIVRAEGRVIVKAYQCIRQIVVIRVVHGRLDDFVVKGSDFFHERGTFR